MTRQNWKDEQVSHSLPSQDVGRRHDGCQWGLPPPGQPRSSKSLQKEQTGWIQRLTTNKRDKRGRLELPWVTSAQNVKSTPNVKSTQNVKSTH